MMQRNKYLDDLGIPIEKYGVNWGEKGLSKKQRKRIKRERAALGFDGRECYDLDRTFIEWLYSHLMKYKEDASKVVLLDDPEQTWTVGSTDYTLLQLIDRCLEHLKQALTIDDITLELEQEKQYHVESAIDVWKIICSSCWW